YVVPALGHLKLVEITPLHLQKFIFALSEQKSDTKTAPADTPAARN
ncbi:MAG: hypothetical protein HFG12_09890, partial [Oscillibacter sp.]|nr:hypothetical protein [Oscillibacter sp.]